PPMFAPSTRSATRFVVHSFAVCDCSPGCVRTPAPIPRTPRNLEHSRREARLHRCQGENNRALVEVMRTPFFGRVAMPGGAWEQRGTASRPASGTDSAVRIGLRRRLGTAGHDLPDLHFSLVDPG